MPILLLSEDDVRRLLPMSVAIEAVQETFLHQAEGKIQNVPRHRSSASSAMLHVLSASNPRWMGYKAYGTSKQGAAFHVGLFDGETGTLKALIQADYLGQMRTGAASGVATAAMARPEANEVGLFGAGKQAAAQLEAVCSVRKIRRAQVYSPHEDRRRQFCQTMSAKLGIDVEPMPRPELAAQDKDIVITATSSRQPVLHGDWLDEGTHLNVIGSNFLAKAEIDAITVRRSEVIVVDSKEQAKLEAGDFVAALQEGSISWGDVHELAEVVAGRQSGRRHAEDVTLFKSLGVAMEDVAVAARVYQRATAQDVGTWIEW